MRRKRTRERSAVRAHSSSKPADTFFLNLTSPSNGRLLIDFAFDIEDIVKAIACVLFSSFIVFLSFFFLSSFFFLFYFFNVVGSCMVLVLIAVRLHRVGRKKKEAKENT